MPPTRRDVLLAAVAAAAVQAELWLTDPAAGSALAGLAVLALAGLRRHPVAAVSVLVAALVADTAAGGVLVSGLATPLGIVCLACFALGYHAAGTQWAAAGAVVAVAGLTAANQLAPDLTYPPLDDAAFFALLLGTPVVLGRLLRRRADVIAELAVHAAALQAARAEAAAAAVAEERARVAIGVHDALAHRIGEISLQAAGAQRVAGAEPARALRALARIEDAARAALDDIRDVIGVLRHGDERLGLAPPHTPSGAVPAPWRAVDARAPAPPPAPEGGVAADALIAAAVFVAIAVDTLTSSRLEGPPAANLAGVALIALPLVWRRRAPLLSAVAVFAAAGLQGALLTPPGLLVTPIVLLLLPPYSVAAYLPLRGALLGLAVCVAGSLAVEPAVPTVLMGLLAWCAGRAVRDRGRRAEELRDVTRRLELAGDAHAAHARGEERLRIARELHDAVAHSMTVIVLQAGAAQRVWADEPAAARVAIAALGDVARTTLSGLRQTLRSETPARLAELDELVARVRPLGLDVTVGHEAMLLPAELDHVVFCVVQEALTNAVRHAAPTSVRVDVRSRSGTVFVEVADTGRASGAPGAAGHPVIGTGTGLRGMAERVGAHGGELRYGPEGGGFRVVARLPLMEPVPA